MMIYAYFVVLAYRWGVVGGCWRSLHCVIRRCCCVEDRCCIQMGGVGWGGGDVNVHCIASPEDVVALKIGVAYRWGRGMLTFIALRRTKMLVR